MVLRSKPVGKNIASTGATFPIVSSTHNLYGRSARENFVVGQTYTVTMKASKPATQKFLVYLSEKQLGYFEPVEGLTDVWTTTIKINELGNSKVSVYIYQTPEPTVGECRIEWLKVEKGDTRTPNIDSYAYHGTVLTTSEEAPTDPNAYTWIGTPLRLTE